MPYLQKQSQKLDLSDHFDFRRFVPKNELTLYLSVTDISAPPSYSEETPLVIPHAMSSGCMIVATQSAAVGCLPRNCVAKTEDYSE
jgi:glycosyltransferase involved in cell wall biosynthesis